MMMIWGWSTRYIHTYILLREIWWRWSMFMNANGEDDAVCVCALLLKGEEWTCDFNCEWGRNFKNERPSPVAAIIAAAAALKKERKMKTLKKGFKWKINAMCTLSLFLFDNNILSPRIILQKYWHNNKRNIKDST